ncbi:MAG: cysteine desulfurase family protein [bacterium]
MAIYFDNAATTRVCPEAAEAALAAMTEAYGNPSSGYALGREARDRLAAARASVAACLGCAPGEVYFTSGGTESDNWALRGAAKLMRHRGKHILTSAAEHDAIRKTAQSLEAEGWEVTYLRPDSRGIITPEAVEAALREDTVLVSLMLVNNEVGSVNPIGEVSRVLRARGSAALLHTDAVQGLLKVPFTPRALGADLVSVSSHKIHGPKGAGALYIRAGLRFPGLLTGGEQEGGLRPGTEAVPALVGFGAAAEVGRALMPEATARMAALKGYLLEELSSALPELVPLGESAAPHILSISLPGWRSEVLMNWLDAQGICVSRSSACKRGARSHVLESMGLPARLIDGAIRISLSRYSTREECDAFTEALTAATRAVRPQKR